jgi:hypothetical protein
VWDKLMSKFTAHQADLKANEVLQLGQAFIDAGCTDESDLENLKFAFSMKRL